MLNHCMMKQKDPVESEEQREDQMEQNVQNVYWLKCLLVKITTLILFTMQLI